MEKFAGTEQAEKEKCTQDIRLEELERQLREAQALIAKMAEQAQVLQSSSFAQLEQRTEEIAQGQQCDVSSSCKTDEEGCHVSHRQPQASMVNDEDSLLKSVSQSDGSPLAGSGTRLTEGETTVSSSQLPGTITTHTDGESCTFEDGSKY